MPAPRRPTPLLPAVTAGLVCVLFLGLGFFVGPGGVVACAPSDPLGEIRERQAAGDFAGTIEPLRELMAERRKDSEVHYRYGLALSRTGQPSLAEWSLREAMNDPEWLLLAGQQLAFNAIGSGNHDRAIEIAGLILDGHPDSVDVLLLRANAYARSRLHYEDALEDVERILELDPDTPEAMEPKILSLLALERIEEAAEAIEELGVRIEQSHLGESSEAWHCATAAIFADDSDEEELASERWADCLERFPGHGNVVTGALKFFDARANYDRSVEILEAALKAEPKSRSYRIRLANRLRFIGRGDESEQLLREAATSEHPQNAALAWFDLAKHLQDIGDHEQASEAQERAVALARDAGGVQPQLLLEYADALLLAGEFDDALAIADEMTLEAHAAMIRARVAQQQGQPAEALEYFEAAFRLWPDNPFARYYAAIASEAVGDFDGAIDAYRYSIRIAANATDARIRLARLHLAEGRPTEALLLLRHQVTNAPLELDGELLSLRLWGLLRQEPLMRRQLERIGTSSPHLVGRALASAAQGVRDRAGAEAALRLLAESSGIDLTAPQNADVLRSLVRFSFESGRGDEARPAVEAAIASRPEVAAFQEIHGLWLELDGGAPDPARTAYDAAIEIDPQNPGALAGLGRLAADPDEALGLFERAATADPLDAEPAWAAAETLISAGRAADAEKRLEMLLEQHPFEHRAASALARLHVEQGRVTERTLERAQRAARFGGGADALDLLGRVHRSRQELELAAAAEERAKALRGRGAEEG